MKLTSLEILGIKIHTENEHDLSLENSQQFTEDNDSREDNQPVRHISALSFIGK